MYDALNIEFKSEHLLLISRPQAVVDDYRYAANKFLLALEGGLSRSTA